MIWEEASRELRSPSKLLSKKISALQWRCKKKRRKICSSSCTLTTVSSRDCALAAAHEQWAQKRGRGEHQEGFMERWPRNFLQSSARWELLRSKDRDKKKEQQGRLDAEVTARRRYDCNNTVANLVLSLTMEQSTGCNKQKIFQVLHGFVNKGYTLKLGCSSTYFRAAILQLLDASNSWIISSAVIQFCRGLKKSV